MHGGTGPGFPCQKRLLEGNRVRPMLHALSTVALVALVILAVTWDLRTRRIPNALTVTGFFTALALRALPGGEALLAGVLGGLIGLILTFPLVLMGGLGGGDAKLLAAVGAFLGPSNLPLALLVTALVGGTMALALAIQRGGCMLCPHHNSGGPTMQTIASSTNGRVAGGSAPARGAISSSIGVESWKAACTPILALAAPGPRVTKHTPGRPVSLPCASAM